MNKRTITLVLALCSATLLPARPVPAAQDCVAKLMATCTSCHYQSRICEQLGKKSKRGWQATLKRMLRYGLVLDEAGQETMVECLVDLKKESGRLCK